jgi:hypothetical protein
MRSPRQTSPSGLVGGLLQSWGRDLKAWTTNIIVRYAVAVALLLGAGAGVIAAAGVGIAALFHWIESHYGSNTAYAAVAGLLLGLSLFSAVVAVWLLKRALPPVPRPHRDRSRTASQSLAANVTLSASVPRKMLLKADPATEVMIGLAAACLVGWLVSSRLGQSRAWARAK